jgi:hypothetical protein
LLVGGLGIVALYLGYQKLVTGQMMLLSHGKNRMAGSHAFDPAFYELLGGRLFDYAPFLSILAPIGLLVALDRRPGALVPVLPLLFVPVAYVVIFDQAARAHEWSLYYFAVPMALLAGMALDSILSRRSLLLVSVCGVLVGVLALYNLEFHRRAKTGIFSDLYDVSIFLRDHLPRESVVYTAIYCQVGYYLEGRAEVLYSLARGDLRQHSYDCYLLDRGATDPTRRKLFPPEGPGESYRSIVASNRYDLVCRKDLFEGHLLLSGSTAPSPRLLRFGKQVRLATTHTIRAPTTVIPLPGQARSLEGAGRLSFSLALASQQDGDAEVAVLMRSEGGTEELLRREVGRREIWHDFIVDLGSSAYDGASLELEVSTPGLGGDVYLGNPLLQSHGQGLTR